MTYIETTRPSCTGETLFTVKYIPEQKPKAALCFHHGLGEHIGRYQRGTTRSRLVGGRQCQGFLDTAAAAAA